MQIPTDAILLGETNANQAGFDMSFVDANGDGNTDLLVGGLITARLPLLVELRIWFMDR